MEEDWGIDNNNNNNNSSFGILELKSSLLKCIEERLKGWGKLGSMDNLYIYIYIYI